MRQSLATRNGLAESASLLRQRHRLLPNHPDMHPSRLRHRGHRGHPGRDPVQFSIGHLMNRQVAAHISEFIRVSQSREVGSPRGTRGAILVEARTDRWSGCEYIARFSRADLRSLWKLVNHHASGSSQVSGRRSYMNAKLSAGDTTSERETNCLWT